MASLISRAAALGIAGKVAEETRKGLQDRMVTAYGLEPGKTVERGPVRVTLVLPKSRRIEETRLRAFVKGLKRADLEELCVLLASGCRSVPKGFPEEAVVEVNGVTYPKFTPDLGFKVRVTTACREFFEGLE